MFPIARLASADPLVAAGRIHLPPGTTVANLAIGNMVFFNFAGTKLLKITTKWAPGQIEPQNVF